ncbi:DUF2478 domain-containing protein [Aliiroseovarius lamellibrachiae]|uniref:DUF2478 domain-containing protein n=1 Tax=Aliiroseovarius lamellibrachiae TaxID=1924933 RepID=UPI001BE11DB6|nr:DUF2478 domain-containing protein [Aliiroseovarius lamellibrachiae]MBT2130649.1 DUF2478 domain-containing protein [Aliiroseovarius lamellibrachiae]
MKLAFTIAPGRGETNVLLADVAERLIRRDVRVAGTVQIDTDRGEDRKCDMDVKVLPDGPLIRISEDRGAGARGCRLDTDALEGAVSDTEAALAKGADLLLVNKFGKHEAEGRGFRDAIAMALEKNIPVLVGVNKLNREAFLAFCGDVAEELPADMTAISNWLDGAVQSR